jgi:hypothetical protein
MSALSDERLMKQHGGNNQLASVLKAYRRAVTKWREAIDGIKSGESDSDRLRRSFERGDKLREEAIAAYNRAFATGH